VAAAPSPSSDAPELVGCNGGPSVRFTPLTVTSPSTGAGLAVGVAGEGPVGVVIANTLTGYHCDWLMWADHLVKRGFRVAVFEYGVVPQTVGIPAMLDRGSDEMAAVGAGLRKLGTQKVVYAGGSLGGSVALVTAVDPAAEAAGVISLSGGLDGMEELAERLSVPALYAAAEEDTGGGVADLARSLHKATPEGRSTLLVYPGAQHAGEMFTDKRYADELQAKLEAFLRDV
jgi:dienelactone hydrolase